MPLFRIEDPLYFNAPLTGNRTEVPIESIVQVANTDEKVDRRRLHVVAVPTEHEASITLVDTP